MRLGFLARAACRQNMTQTAQARWRLALGHTGSRLGPLLWLLAASEPSGQAPDPVLWRIVHQFPNELWAWDRLEQFYSRAQDTPALNLVYSELAACRPQDFVAQNNFAATSLLLKRNLTKAHAIARELHVQKPDDLIIASTYALSLHLQGRTQEGLALLQKCPMAALETPPLALYYGVLLAANGQTNLAGRFLSLAQGSALLPEERALALEAAHQAPRP
jgi:hypothetical protein